MPVLDGLHRLEANLLLGHTLIDVDLLEHLKEADAYAFAMRANSTQGLKRSRKDIKHLITSALQRPEYARLSYRQIAKASGLSHMTVFRYLKPRKIHHPSDSNSTTSSIVAIAIESMRQQLTHIHVVAPIEASDIRKILDRLTNNLSTQLPSSTPIQTIPQLSPIPNRP